MQKTWITWITWITSPEKMLVSYWSAKNMLIAWESVGVRVVRGSPAPSPDFCYRLRPIYNQ